MRRYSTPAPLFGLILSATATTSVALPADVGRTADIYANSVRYFAAKADSPVNWPSPKSRPDTLVTVAAETAEQVPVIIASRAEASESAPLALEIDPLAVGLNAGLRAAMADARIGEEVALTINTTPDPFAIAMDERLKNAVLADTPLIVAGRTEPSDNSPLASETDPLEVGLNAGLRAAVADAHIGEEVALTTNTTPDPFAVAMDDRLQRAVAEAVVAEVIAQTTNVADNDAPQSEEVLLAAMVNERFRQAIAWETAAHLAASAAEPALSEATLVSLAETDPISSAAGSSRQGQATPADLVAVAAASTETQTVADSSDLMANMADADANLVMRDGGEDGQDTMMMSSDVLFAFGSATLAEDALETLASIGKMSTDVPVIEVFGHTDAVGSESSNLQLGQRRAEAVRDWLLNNTAFTEDRVIATGIGEVDPVAPNLLSNGKDNPDGRAQNRRVEFAIHEAGYVPE